MNINSLYPQVCYITDEVGDEQLGLSPLAPSSQLFSRYDLDNCSLQTTNSAGESYTLLHSKHRAWFNQRPPPLPLKFVDDSSTTDQRDDNNPNNWGISSPKVRFHDIYLMTRQQDRGNNTGDTWEVIHRGNGFRYTTKVVDKRDLTKRDLRIFQKDISILQEIREGAVGVDRFVDFFENSSRFFILTEYTDGIDLSTRIARDSPPLDENEVCLIARSILFGVRHLHKNHICHRNLRPQHIVLHQIVRDGSVQWNASISDFGSATRMLVDDQGENLPLVERCPLSAYTAPEIVQRGAYDSQVDLWSIGVIAYHALAAKLPFKAPTKNEVCEKICKADYSFPLSDWGRISKSAKRFVASLLFVDPSVRLDDDEALAHPWIAGADDEDETGEKSQRCLTRKTKLMGLLKVFTSRRNISKSQDSDESSICSSTTISGTASHPNSCVVSY